MRGREKIHGGSGTRLYSIWIGMKRRCKNPNRQNYKHYGENGITVCDEWINNFQAFYDWSMVNGYSEDLTIDRIDVRGNYSPENCRWATKKDQANNRRSSHVLTYNGKTQTLRQWAEEYGVNYGTFVNRIDRNNWPIEKALTTPAYGWRTNKKEDNNV